MTTPNQQLAEPPDYSSPIAPELRETFRALDGLGPGMIAVLSASVTAPPGSPVQGAVYLVPAGATGAWAGHSRHIAIFTPTGWLFRAPRPGWFAVVLDERAPFGRVYEYTGLEWAVWLVGADQVSIDTAGTDFGSETLAQLVLEINARFLADEAILTAHTAELADHDATLADHTSELADHDAELTDHEARITVLEGGGGGGAVGYPGTLDDLVFWWQGDQVKVASGATLPAMTNFCPWYSFLAPKVNSGVTRAATQLNGLNVFTYPANQNGRYNWQAGITLKKVTVFAVYKPSSFANPATFICGAANSYQFRVENTGKAGANKCNVAGIGTATTAMVTGTWYQINMTYDDASGAYAFRQASAANGSGTNAQTISADTFVTGYNQQLGSEDLAGDLAELIVYNRVLSGTEIGNVEAYLLAKWGV